MNDTEELIKAALAKSAARAPHPGQILNELNTPRRRARPAVMAIIGAVVVVAAIAVPTVLRNATPPAPTATQYAVSAPQFISTRFTVTDIPAGFVEGSRTADIDSGEVGRGWMNGDQAVHMTVYTPNSPKWKRVSVPGTQKVEIGRSSGWWVLNDSTLAEVAWQPDADTVVKVQVLGPDAATRARNAAESVRPDVDTGVRPVLSFGQLPERFRRVQTLVFGSSPDTGQAWLRATIDGAQHAEIRARIVAKGKATLDGWNVIVPAPDGRDIELRYNGDSRLSDGEALEIADAIKVVQPPDFSWLGK